MTLATPPDTASGGRPLALEHVLLRLQRWPNLSRMPAEADLRITARVCALLARQPTVGFFIPRLLNLPRDEVAPVLAVLQRQGVIEAARLSGTEDDGPPGPALMPSEHFIAQLWGLFMR